MFYFTFLQVQLADWKKVLNKLDLRICNIMHAWRHEIILSAETSGDQPPESADLLSDLDDLKLILRFTSSLLRNAINKEVYNSAEVSKHNKLIFVLFSCLSLIFLLLLMKF